jgi:hypothetical protein
MLQPIPARPFFRLLEAPLGIGAIAAGIVVSYFAIGASVDRWIWIGFLLLGLPMVVFGVLALIHAATGCLPEWVVGSEDDASSSSDSRAS